MHLDRQVSNLSWGGSSRFNPPEWEEGPDAHGKHAEVAFVEQRCWAWVGAEGEEEVKRKCILKARKG